jgi:hypothetical protein
MSAEEILQRHTLFPYYSRFVTPERRAKGVNNIISPDGRGYRAALGMQSGRMKSPDHLRFCTHCLQQDIEEFGETYWRRTHQAPGVLVCPDHGNVLYGIELESGHRYLYVDATVATPFGVSGQWDTAIEKEHSKALALARRSAQFLREKPPRWDADLLSHEYREAAKQRGFLDGLDEVDVAAYDAAFTDFWSSDLIAALPQVDGRAIEGRRMVEALNWKSRSAAPMLHALTQVFLEAHACVAPDKTLGVGVGPFKCPLGADGHDEEYPVKDVRAGTANESAKAVAVCDCGFRFTFTSLSPDDPRLPVVERFIGSRHRPKAWSRDQARKEWLAAIAAGKNDDGADRLRPIRNWLKKNDKEWYESTLDRLKSAHSITDAYAARDEQYVELLRLAIERLKARGKVPFARRTLAAEAGLADHLVRAGFREGKHPFPKCKDLLLNTPELKRQGAWVGAPRMDLAKMDEELALKLKARIDELASSQPDAIFARPALFAGMGLNYTKFRWHIYQRKLPACAKLLAEAKNLQHKPSRQGREN